MCLASRPAEQWCGAYTLDIDTLPQVVAVESQSLLPGFENLTSGPTTSIVLVFQGDRLDPATAENPANYTITWLGPDGRRGTADDRQIQLGAAANSVVYDASSNVDVSSGLTYPTAIRQTVTLLFDQPLPVGGYEIKVSAAVVANGFNLDESDSLAAQSGFTGHPVVSVSQGTVNEGAVLIEQNLVKPSLFAGNFGVFQRGTRFLNQFYTDLGSLLDSQLTREGDQEAISQDLLNQIATRFSPALGPLGHRLAELAVVFLDPISFELDDPADQSFNYNLRTNTVAGNLPQTFIEVGGNDEVVVIPNPTGTYELNVTDIGVHLRTAAGCSWASKRLRSTR